jgi:hypothetical protein
VNLLSNKSDANNFENMSELAGEPGHPEKMSGLLGGPVENLIEESGHPAGELGLSGGPAGDCEESLQKS